MTALELLSTQPWVQRFGWTLLHFLWQGVLIAAAYAAVRSHRWSAHARYLLACTALATLLAAPLATWRVLQPPDSASVAPDRTARIPSTPSLSTTPVTPLPERIRATVPSRKPAPFLPWVVTLWMTGATLLWIRLLGGWAVAVRMRTHTVRPAPPEWQLALRRLAGRIGVSKPVSLAVSSTVPTPLVVGWLRPLILVPVGALSGLPPDQVEALLLHELAHIRRHDALVNLLQSVAEALLFYHPAVWWVSGHIRTERELCCDDLAVAATGDTLTYVCALAELETCRPSHVEAVLAANGGSLAHRIARLLGQRRPEGSGAGPVLAIGITVLLATVALFAQSADHPAFQVASIKRNTEVHPNGRIVRPQPGGRISARNAPLVMLIQNAYHLQAYQIVGGPEWINSDGYDIEAKPEAETDRPTSFLMLQTLLTDRFKLAVHRDTRDLPVYALVATKSLHLAPPKDPDCAPTIPGTIPVQGTRGENSSCGSVRISMSPSGLLMFGQSVPLSEFVRMLASALGRPVLDHTSFAGKFDLSLSFTPDELTQGIPGAGGAHDPGGPTLASDPNRPNIAAALQEQLGLKLESTKGPVEVLVIDHIERPSEN